MRDYLFDVSRALCIIEIVCLWHITNYLDVDISRSFTEIGGCLTIAVLGFFTFMSGYFLKNKKIENANDIICFYYARIKRFWLLYFIASSVLYATSTLAGQPWYPSFTNFVLSLFGLTIFIMPLPPTLWYMVMLIFFYILTPFLLFVRHYKLRLVVVIAIYFLLICLHSRGYLDGRLLTYYPMYVLGLLLPNKFVDMIKNEPLFSIFGGGHFDSFIDFRGESFDLMCCKCTYYTRNIIYVSKHYIFKGLSDFY